MNADVKPRIQDLEPSGIRARIRAGGHTIQTAGLAPGYAQGNLAILPADWVGEFLQFCIANPKPCPLLAVGRPGDPSLPGAGADIDIRADLPGYRVFRNGALVDRVGDITPLWRDDFVTFLIGCSFSFEGALLRAGIGLRHIERGCNVPMYRTNIDCTPAGRFSGKLVVSMRPFRPDAAIRAIEITGRLPQVHGAPVHFGDPSAIGIADATKPDWGDAVPIEAGEVPVFWACGVTPQVALANARPPIAITHEPGSMLVTDIREADMLSGAFHFEPAAL